MTDSLGEEFDETVALIEAGAKAQRDNATREKIEQADKYLRERLEPQYAKAITAKIKSGKRSREIYKSIFRGFAAYCGYLDAPALPATAGFVAGYLQELLTEKKADVARLRREVAAISFAHRALGLLDPTDDPLVGAMVRTASNKVKNGNGTKHH